MTKEEMKRASFIVMPYKRPSHSAEAGIEVYTTSSEAIGLLGEHIRNRTHRETKQEVLDAIVKVKRDLQLTAEDFDWID